MSKPPMSVRLDLDLVANLQKRSTPKGGVVPSRYKVIENAAIHASTCEGFVEEFAKSAKSAKFGNDLVDVETASKMLGIKPRTVRDWTKKNNGCPPKLLSIKPGRAKTSKIWIYIHSIDEHLRPEVTYQD